MHMKTTIAEFRAHLKDYFKRMQEGEIIEIAGLNLGDVHACTRCTDVADKKDVQVPKRDPEKFKELKKQLDVRANPNNFIRDHVQLIAGEKISTDIPGRVLGEESKMYSGRVSPLEAPTNIDGYTEDGLRHDACELCRKRQQLYVWYEEGEHRICGDCAKKSMGAKAVSWLLSAKKVEPTGEGPKAAPTVFHKQSTGEQREVNYCSVCHYRAVWNGATKCSKCNIKKKKTT